MRITVRQIDIKTYLYLLLVFLLFSLLINLGFWQLKRAEEKQVLIEENSRQESVFFDKGVDYQNGQLVILNGRYLNDFSFLLDNQVVNGNVGYDVITPFVNNDMTIAMINRGWIEADKTRRILPTISSSNANQVVVRVYRPNKDIFRLSDQQFSNESWPKRIQYFSVNYMNQEIQKSSTLEFNSLIWYPHLLRVNEASDELAVHWRFKEDSVARHKAYAVQWFAMAFVLISLVLYFVYKRKREYRDGSL